MTVAFFLLDSALSLNPKPKIARPITDPIFGYNRLAKTYLLNIWLKFLNILFKWRNLKYNPSGTQGHDRGSRSLQSSWPKYRKALHHATQGWSGSSKVNGPDMPPTYQCKECVPEPNYLHHTLAQRSLTLPGLLPPPHHIFQETLQYKSEKQCIQVSKYTL